MFGLKCDGAPFEQMLNTPMGRRRVLYSQCKHTYSLVYVVNITLSLSLSRVPVHIRL